MFSTFNIIDGGLGRPIPGTDYYTGLVFFPATYPTGFSNADKIKLVYTLEQAEALGITEALYPLEHYHISEFFRGMGRVQDTPRLWIYLGDTVGLETYDGTQIQTLVDFTDSEVKQIGVYTNETFASSLITDTDTVTAALLAENRPVTVLLAADFTAVNDLTALADLRAIDKKGVGVVIGQDGSGVGAALAVTLGKSVTSLGLTMGTMAAIDVASNIGYVRDLNLVNGDEYQSPAYANGTLVKNVDQATQASINTKGYVSIVSYINKRGSYHYDSPLAVAVTSDFAYIENDRVINKAIRVIDEALFDFKNSKIFINSATGQIQESSATLIERAALGALNAMAKSGEISFDEGTGLVSPRSVVVDRISSVLATSTVNISVKIVPVGIARAFTINIGFVPKI